MFIKCIYYLLQRSKSNDNILESDDDKNIFKIKKDVKLFNNRNGSNNDKLLLENIDFDTDLHFFDIKKKKGKHVKNKKSDNLLDSNFSSLIIEQSTTELSHSNSPVKRLRNERYAFFGNVLNCELKVTKNDIKISKVDKSSFRRPYVVKANQSCFTSCDNSLFSELDNANFNLDSSVNLDLNKSWVNNFKVIDKLGKLSDYCNTQSEIRDNKRKNSIIEVQTSYQPQEYYLNLDTFDLNFKD